MAFTKNVNKITLSNIVEMDDSLEQTILEQQVIQQQNKTKEYSLLGFNCPHH